MWSETGGQRQSVDDDGLTEPGSQRQAGDDETFLEPSSQRQVGFELTVARSTVAKSVPEERGHSVVDSTTTAANVGICSSRSSSTSSALCRLDNLHYDLPNLSVTVKN